MTSSGRTKLIVLRGNSGSGKSTIAQSLRDIHGSGLAWVSQDHIRRIMLKERNAPAAVNIGLIDHVVRYCLEQGYHVVLDGILTAEWYEQMLTGLSDDLAGRSHFYYLDVSVDETFRRHAMRPQATEFTTEQMGSWYRPRDLLGKVTERIIPESSTLPQTLAQIVAETELLGQPGPG